MKKIGTICIGNREMNMLGWRKACSLCRFWRFEDNIYGSLKDVIVAFINEKEDTMKKC